MSVAEPSSSRSSDGASVEDLLRRREELDELRERIMNVVGHALRTPMATLRGLVEVVAEDPDRIADPEFRAGLVRSAQRLERLLDDLLVASGVETRLPVGSPQPLDVGAELRLVLDELADDRVAEVEITAQPGARVRMARDGLQWILTHLVRNALLYGGPRLEATVEATSDRVVLRLRSPDADPSDEELANAFELFYRGEYAVMADAIGLGVGLPVARRLTEQAGGTLALERSTGGHGVTAVLEVPSA